MSGQTIKTLYRAGYIFGTFFLLIGLLLSLVTQPVQASTNPIPAQNDLAGNPPDWDRSSLVFQGGCSGNCQQVTALVCNGGSGDMTGTVDYEVYYAATGNPKNGVIVDTGTVGPLDSGECETLTYNPDGVAGNYMFRVEQRPGHPGQGELWSDGCSVSGCTQPTNTPTPVTPTATPVTPTATPVTPTATPVTPTKTPITPTATFTPTNTPVTPTATPVTPTKTPITPTATFTPTSTPVTPTATPVTPTPTFTPTVTPTDVPQLILYLSYICGYSDAELSYWKVTNPNPYAVSFNWEAIGSSESGSGTVPANGEVFFSTLAGPNVVYLYVGEMVIAESAAGEPCLMDLTMAYQCVEGIQVWTVTNGNDFDQAFNWASTAGPFGTGLAPALGATTFSLPGGVQTITLTYAHPLFGERTVSQETGPITCAVLTATPLPTPTVAVTQTPSTPDPTDEPDRDPTPTVYVPTLPPPTGGLATPVLIPVTGVDNAGSAPLLPLSASLFVNLGLVFLGAAVSLQGAHKWMNK